MEVNAFPVLVMVVWLPSAVKIGGRGEAIVLVFKILVSKVIWLQQAESKSQGELLASDKWNIVRGRARRDNLFQKSLKITNSEVCRCLSGSNSNGGRTSLK